MRRARIFAIATLALFLCAAPLLAQNTPAASLYGSSWNAISPSASPPQPNPWCPQDSNGTIATLSTMRLWDSGVKWSQIETSASSPTDTSGYSFTKTDYVANTLRTASGCNMAVIYQFGATPTFAITGSGLTGCATPGNSSCIPPKDVNGDGTGADAWWMNFVAQMVARYKGKYKYYGIWNEADSSNFWCWTGSGCNSSNGGNPTSAPNVPSLNNLVLMAWDAKKLINCLDPSAEVISPDGHVGTMTTWFENYSNTSFTAPARSFTFTPIAGGVLSGPQTCSWSAQTITGKDTYDIVDEHMRGTTSTNTDPTSVIAAYNAAVTAMTSLGILSRPLFNDEWGLNHGQSANVATAAAFLADNLALQSSFSSPNIQVEAQYQWDKGDFPPSRSIVGLANDVVAGWMIGSTVNPYTNVGSVYSITGTLGTGGSFQLMFDKSKTCSGTTISTCATANQSAGSFQNYTDISGIQHTVAGGVVPVGLAPILLTGPAAGPQANAPMCSPNGGTFATSQSVSCSSTSSGAILCFNTTGSPATNGSTGCAVGSTLYSGPLTVNTNETLYVVAGGTGYTDSTVYSATFVFHGSAPTFSPGAGTYSGSQTVTITDPQSLAMAYTTDGTTPTSDGAGHITNGTAYTVPLVIAASEILKAIGYQSGWNDSGVGSAAYIINYTLSVTVSGIGTVSSVPIGINSCSATGGTCSALFGQGTAITLTAGAGSGYTFAGWSGGGCSGTGTCVVTLNSSTSVTATFTVNNPAAILGQPGFGVMLQ